MTSKQQNVTLDAWFADTVGGAGNGKGNKMSVGKGTGAWAWQQRFALSIPRGTLFDGVPSAASISAFDIRLRANSGNSGIGSAVHFYLERGTTTFTEYQITQADLTAAGATNANAVVSAAGPASGEWPGPTRTTTDRAEFTGSPAADAWIKVSALALGRWWFAHPEVAALVLVAVAVDETATNQRCTFYTRESTSAPYAEITYGGNSPPDKPTNVTIIPGADGTSFAISATYTDPDGDSSPRFEIVFDPD